MNIPPALLDRMEVIRLSGYTEDEKTNIAIATCCPSSRRTTVCATASWMCSRSAMRDIVRYYTREAGVRSLERELSKICRKVVKGLLLKKYTPTVVVNAGQPERFPGCAQVQLRPRRAQNQVGQVVGLAWTEVGGDLLTIEVAIMPGKGVITRTGSLGDVMKESVEAARTVVRSRAAWASRTSSSRSATSTSTCRTAPRPRTGRALARP
jgi:ATP-dependent Lon protease